MKMLNRIGLVGIVAGLVALGGLSGCATSVPDKWYIEDADEYAVELAHDYPNYWVAQGWSALKPSEMTASVEASIKGKATEACGRFGRRPGKFDRIRYGQCYQQRNVAFVGWACDSGQILVRITCVK